MYVLLGLVVTVSLPVYDGTTFIGVAGVDISMADLMEDVAFLKEGSGSLSYAFVIDSLKHTLVHPLVPQPQDVTDDPVFVDISHLEYDKDTTDVIQSMAE